MTPQAATRAQAATRVAPSSPQAPSPALSRGYGDDPALPLDPALHVEVEGQPQLTRHQLSTKTAIDHDVRCQGVRPDPHRPDKTQVCNKLLAEVVARPWRISCPRCSCPNKSPGFDEMVGKVGGDPGDPDT
jgi:hypothetical protein